MNKISNVRPDPCPFKFRKLKARLNAKEFSNFKVSAEFRVILPSLRARGISIAIDDFGTGFSSLSSLSKLPVDTLKIDCSFVIEMTETPEGLSLVSTIINLAHSLKLKVVMEVVEIKEQRACFRC